jgi:hypothetical protein
MKIHELLNETEFDSTDVEWVNDITKDLRTYVKYFNVYVQQYGSDGANNKFQSTFDSIDGIKWYMDILVADTRNQKLINAYTKMEAAREALENKIENSGGLSY